MKSLTICFLVVLIFSLLGSGLLAQPKVDVCPVNPDDELIEEPIFPGEAVSSSKDYTVPRKQVLLELFGRPT